MECKKKSGNGGGPFPRQGYRQLLRCFGGKMTDGFSGKNFQHVIRTAGALRGKPQPRFCKVDALETGSSQCVADSHDSHDDDEPDGEEGFGDDKLADKIDLEDEQDRKAPKHGLANLWFFSRLQKKALRLFPQLVHDP